MQSVLIVLSICVAMAYGQDAACLATGLADAGFLPCVQELAVSQCLCSIMTKSRTFLASHN